MEATGKDAYETLDRDLGTLYEGLEYMRNRELDELDLLADDEGDIVTAGIQYGLGVLLDVPEVTRDDIHMALDKYLAVSDQKTVHTLWLSKDYPYECVEVLTFWGAVLEMTYRYASWEGETYERDVSRDEPLGMWAQDQVESLIHGGI